MPERVSIFKVTKFRPGEVTITRAATISRSRAEPCGAAGASVRGSTGASTPRPARGASTRGSARGSFRGLLMSDSGTPIPGISDSSRRGPPRSDPDAPQRSPLHPDRLFPADPATRAIARRLYESVRALPIISPHGHTDPRWFADDAPFSDPATLLITPDHYIFRMLYSQGVPLEELGIAPRDAGAPRPGSGRSDRNGPAIEPFTPPDSRSVWRRFAEHYFLFRG